MQDNEAMVKRTIAEFRSGMLLGATSNRIINRNLDSLYAFYVYQVCHESARVSEKDRHASWFHWWRSLEQISISDRIKICHSISFLWDSKENRLKYGREGIIQNCRRVEKEPALFIEGLSLYRRPYLIPWMGKDGSNRSLNWKISDLLALVLIQRSSGSFVMAGGVHI